MFNLLFHFIDIMASRYEGRIKYLGEDSYTMEFKLAFLLLEEDCAKWLLRSFLCCKPEQVYKSHEVGVTRNILPVLCVFTFWRYEYDDEVLFFNIALRQKVLLCFFCSVGKIFCCISLWFFTIYDMHYVVSLDSVKLFLFRHAVPYAL